MSESIHDKLKRVRKPRVHLSYEVETNGVTQQRELPFVVGVMGDYSGDNIDGKKALRDRKFVNVDQDNLNETMAKIAPSLSIKVDNFIANDGSEMPLDLHFSAMEDFEPQNLVKQIEPLSRLLDARNKLRDLLSKADRSDKLESVLEDILKNPDNLKNLSATLDAICSEAGE
ncbi:MAG TPA: type VI secretion system contractile sheath small subunit [Pseudomonadales bacterium]|nr:type VI secretion system contractile sheath small subunit [Pseudomonadales bacterium]